jgi:hypothetical protein
MYHLHSRTPPCAVEFSVDDLFTNFLTHAHTHTQVEQHTSPFELQQIPTLFANFGKKFKHEVSKSKKKSASASFRAVFLSLAATMYLKLDSTAQ